MTTILKDFAELARQLDQLDLQPKIELGDVFWVKNSVLQFDDCSVDDFHPVVVVGLSGQTAMVRIMTSQTKGHKTRGVVVKEPWPRSRRNSLILTGKFALRYLPLAEFDYSNYLNTLGPTVLTKVDQKAAE